MYIPEDEKEGRKGALKKLMDLMGKGAGDKIGSMGKEPMTAIEVEVEPVDEESSEGPSDDEKSMIEELYHKYCK